MGVRVLGVTLTTAQEILYWFLLPALLRAALFIAEISLAIGVAQHHFAQGNLRWGFATVTVLYTASVAYFVATVARPDAWEHATPRATALWFCARLAQLVFFPAWAVYRYGKRLFWSLDALMSRGTRREEALDKASRPSRVELYLFAHAFLHSAPQAALQLGVALVQCGLHETVDDSQVLLVLTSLGMLSVTLASFQRFESQRPAGRREPWAVEPATLPIHGKPATPHDANKTATLPIHGKPATPHDASKPVTLAKAAAVAATTPPTQPAFDVNVDVHVEREEADARSPPSLAPSSVTPLSSSTSSLASSDSTPSSAATPPAPSRERPPTPPPLERLLPPEERAPSPPLPTRRRTETALEEDDPLGRSVAGVGWFLFLASRYGAVLSLASFRPGVVAGVLASHVVLAGVFLMYTLERRSVVKVLQRCSLALVFLICPLEYGVRFARARLVFTAFLVVTCTEDMAMTLAWFKGDLEEANADTFWHGYLVAVVFGARALSLLCLGLYVALLRPKVSTFYVD